METNDNSEDNSNTNDDISENTLFRGIKVELGEPVNEPLSDNQEEKAFPF